MKDRICVFLSNEHLANGYMERLCCCCILKKILSFIRKKLNGLSKKRKEVE